MRLADHRYTLTHDRMYPHNVDFLASWSDWLKDAMSRRHHNPNGPSHFFKDHVAEMLTDAKTWVTENTTKGYIIIMDQHPVTKAMMVRFAFKDKKEATLFKMFNS